MAGRPDSSIEPLTAAFVEVVVTSVKAEDVEGANVASIVGLRVRSGRGISAVHW
jgi:hypothetical protein